MVLIRLIHQLLGAHTVHAESNFLLAACGASTLISKSTVRSSLTKELDHEFGVENFAYEHVAEPLGSVAQHRLQQDHRGFAVVRPRISKADPLGAIVYRMARLRG